MLQTLPIKENSKQEEGNKNFKIEQSLSMNTSALETFTLVFSTQLKLLTYIILSNLKVVTVIIKDDVLDWRL